MKNSFLSFAILIGISAFNLLLFCSVTYVAMWSISNETGLLPYYLPNTVIAILVTLFSMVAKKNGARGSLWLPIILSLGVILIDLFLIVAFINNTSNIFLISVLVVTLICLYLLFKYYYLFHKKNLAE